MRGGGGRAPLVTTPHGVCVIFLHTHGNFFTKDKTKDWEIQCSNDARLYGPLGVCVCVCVYVSKDKRIQRPVIVASVLPIANNYCM